MMQGFVVLTLYKLGTLFLILLILVWRELLVCEHSWQRVTPGIWLICFWVTNHHYFIIWLPAFPVFLNFEELIKNLNSLFPVWGIVDMRPFVRINLFGHRLNNITSASSLCLDHWPSAISMEVYVILVS